MSARTAHLVQKGSGFYARIRVPDAVREAFGKTELWAPLHATSRAEAKRKLPGVVAPMKAQIEAALAQTRRTNAATPVARKGRPLSPHQLALSHYGDLMRFDDEARATDHRYASIGLLNDQRAAALKRAASGGASDDELEQLVGRITKAYQSNGNLTADVGSREWREAAIALAVAELEAEGRTFERNEGDFSGKPSHPLLTEKPKIETPKDALAHRVMGPDSLKPLKDLLPAIIEDRKALPATNREMIVTVRMLDDILGEARPLFKITRQDIQTFRRTISATPSNYTKRFPGKTILEAIEANKALARPYQTLDPKTVNDKYLARLHGLLNWCLRNDLIPDNPAAGVKAEVPKIREPSRVNFSAGDLSRIFHPDRFEAPYSEPQWAMLIALFSGMRASELAQIELDNIRTERGVLLFGIDKSKTKQPRLVPVHSALIALGLNDLVKELRRQGEQHLLPDWYSRGMKAKAAAAASGKPALLNEYFPRFIPKWFNRSYLPEVGIHDARKTFHSFRHTFKTALAMAGVEKSRRDDLCGHRDDSAGAGYIHGTSIQSLQEAVEMIAYDGFELAL